MISNILNNYLSPSGYIKAHRLKYQTVFFPNGMVAGVYGTSGNNNDVGVLNLSRLATYLEQLLHPDFT
jgi:hypothetical protein